MTFSLVIGATDVAGKMVLPDGLGELTSAADGQPNECLIQVDDPNGVMTFLELDDVVAEESACANPRLFTGIVTIATHERGNYRDGPGRIWNITITDLNERLHRRVLHDADADRPAETGTERLDFLLASVAMNGLVADNGKVMANAWQYDPDDLRSSYADDVLASIISASATDRFTAFAYWDPVAFEASLFYGEVTTTTYDSTLALTNVPGEKDDSTIFATHVDASMVSQAEPIYTGGYSRWEGGQIYRERASTIAAYGKRRDGVMDSVRINNPTTAARHLETWLDVHSGPIRVVTVTVQLPRDKVNLIDAGMRTSGYFSHIEGYDAGYTFVRVSRRSVRFTNGRNDFYDVTLELSDRGINQAGGGGGGVTSDGPHIPPTSPVYQWSATATTTNATGPASLTVTHSAPLATDILVGLAQCGGALVRTWPAGWTEIDSGTLWSLAIATGITTADTTVTFSSGTAVHPVVGVVAIRGGAYETFASRDEPGSPGSTTPALPSITPAAGNDAVIVALAAVFQGYSQTVAPAGYTVRQDVVSNDGVGSTRLDIWTKAVNPTSGAYTGSPTYANTLQGDLHQVVISGGAASSPPLKLQAFGPVTPNETPDGATSTFTLPAGYEWATGSLKVKDNNIDVTSSVISQDGATRTFTLNFNPWVGDLIEVFGQGM